MRDAQVGDGTRPSVSRCVCITTIALIAGRPQLGDDALGRYGIDDPTDNGVEAVWEQPA